MSEKSHYSDKNNERRMLYGRCKQIKNFLGSKIFTNSTSTGTFLFSEGQRPTSDLNGGEWKEFTINHRWGFREQYCRFKQTVEIPESFAGKKTVYEVNPFPDSGWDSSAQQFIIFVNGIQVQGLDSNHKFIFLSDSATPGEKYEIMLAAYCDDWKFSGTSQLSANIKIFNEDINGLYYDLCTLLETAEQFTEDDNERVDIIKAVNAACNLLETCTPDEEIFINSVKAAREYLKNNIFGAKSDVTISAIGHTHIDTAWLWRLRQTREKAGRSFATVLNLMKEFPEYKFMSPQAQLYDFVKQDYPELYGRIKQAVKDNRWEPEGSMWVESDTNVISGESLVRQFMFGKRFFREEFGKDNKIMWLPDVFGYSGAIPQVMKLAGIDYFMTTKISWNEYTRFPYDTFTWEGIDGTKILAHFEPSTDNDDTERFFTTYNADISPRLAKYSWKRYSNKDLNKNILCSYGHGDGGGGPTRKMLENIRRMDAGIPGCPNTKQEFALDFFKRLEAETAGNPHMPKWRGELYLEYHRGTLTAQARNKKYNRKSEFMFHNAEALCETAHLLNGFDYPTEKINEAWKIILLNQFHDIIPGSSIAPVYEDSKEQYEKILTMGKELKKAALSSVAKDIAAANDSIVVFNTFGLTRTETAVIDTPFDDDITVYSPEGKKVPTQKTFDGKTIFLAEDIPAYGYKTFTYKKEKPEGFAVIHTDATGVENDSYILNFDKDMNIASYYCKAQERTVTDNKQFGKLTAYEDRSHQYEAWDIKCYYTEKSWDVNSVDSVKVAEEGAVRTVIDITRHFNTSVIHQYYIFYPHTSRIDIMYDIDWKEKNVALKADYPVDVNTDRATFDIQFGNLQRSSTENTLADFAQFESCGHKWVDLSDNGFGLSVLNDCKYGWTVKDGHIRPTLLRSATNPNVNQDRERHQFTYALYPHAGAVCNSDVVRQGYNINLPFETLLINAQQGNMPGEFSLISTSAENIIIETVKKAEDSDSLIVRMYETMNKKTDTCISFAKDIASVSICNLLEEEDTALEFNKNAVKLSFRPFEIKTLKINF